MAEGGIPNRWLYCPRKASALVADKFIAFKTPLSSKYNELVPEECRFPPKMLFAVMKSQKVKLGLWIDLTNTSRFYDKSEIEDMECRYVKINCRGHGETPSEDQTQSFLRIVSEFIRSNPLQSVAVHCTHGFNRTGFLIVSYLVEQMDWSVQAALREFGKVRHPGIYKEDYIMELCKRYDGSDDVPIPPPLPTWHTESDDGNGDDNSYDERAESSGSKKHRRREISKIASFIIGIPGVSQFTTQPRLGEIQQKIQSMCGWKNSGFPGSQPVSMDTHNMNKIHEKPYRVSWKADGVRYMMLIDRENEVYMFDRDNCAFHVKNIKFPRKRAPDEHLENTLVDGEMVIDIVNGKKIPRYLCYDIIKIDGKDVGKTEFYPVRLGCIENEIVGPRHEAMTNGRINRNNEPFSIRLKQFWDLSQAGSLLGEKFAKSLSHEPDGLIFQPSKESYIAGRCDEVLKWKPSSMNSVDFRLKIVNEEGEGILRRKIGHLYVGQLLRPFAQMLLCKEIKDLDNKIIECKYENNQWVFMRERTDKSFPNSYTTAKAVCNSIADPVTQEKLLAFIHLHRFRDDSDRMPPPPKRQRML